ncbi:MAG: sortase [Intestinimonas sp.]
MTVLILLPCAKVWATSPAQAPGRETSVCADTTGAPATTSAQSKDLEIGDTIRYQTSLGTRTYAVSSVKIIDWTDWSYLNSTSDNRITIITCLANQPTKRVCVQGIEISS